jgi:methylmalonyl-CoA mutase
LLAEVTPEHTPRAAPEAVSFAHDPITPLPWLRLSEPFERLRDAAKTARARLFCATLGPLAEFAPRANFAVNLCAAGGLEVVGADAAYIDQAAMIAAFGASGCSIAVLCGADARYATDAARAAAGLKAAGARWVVYAGKPADEASLRAAGIDQFIFAGQDALQELATLHTALGIAP